MGRISVYFTGFVAVIAISVAVCHGYFIQEIDNNDIYGEQQGTNSLPMLYGQGLSTPYQQQQQLQQRQLLLQHQKQQQQQQQFQQEQIQPNMFLARMGRNKKRSSFSNPRLDDAEQQQDDYDEEEDDTLSYAASKRKKHPKNKKKKDTTKLSFPRRVFKKTKNAISSTTKAVFGAPKYIFTRYRDSLGFGEKKEKKGKGKGKGHEKGWGWDDHQDDHHDDHHDDNKGWGGWESSAGSSSNRYERIAGAGDNSRPYRYNKYSYSQPDEMRQLAPMSSLNAWIQ